MYLFEGIAGNGLECLVYIDGLFGARLEVRDVALALTPRLGSLCRNLRKQTHVSPLKQKERDIFFKFFFLLVTSANEAQIPPSSAFHSPVCSPGRSCCLVPQRGSSRGLGGWPGWGTRPSSCPGSWTCWAPWRRTPARSSRRHGRTPRPETGTSPDLPCPRSEKRMEERGYDEELVVKRENCSTLSFIPVSNMHMCACTHTHTQDLPALWQAGHPPSLLWWGSLLQLWPYTGCWTSYSHTGSSVRFSQHWWHTTQTWCTHTYTHSKSLNVSVIMVLLGHDSNHLPRVAQNDHFQQHLLPGCHPSLLYSA